MSINQIGGKYFSAIAASSNPLSNSLPEGEMAIVLSPSRGRLGWGWVREGWDEGSTIA